MSSAEQLLLRLNHNEKIELHNLLTQQLNGYQSQRISIMQELLDSGTSKLMARDKANGMTIHYIALKYNISDNIVESILKIEKSL